MTANGNFVLPIITPYERFSHFADSTERMGRPERVDGLARVTGECGDSVEMSLMVDGDRICQVRYVPEGCRHTRACAGALAEMVEGMGWEEALEIDPERVESELGGLPEDHRHCARLAVNALGEALSDHLARLRGAETGKGGS